MRASTWAVFFFFLLVTPAPSGAQMLSDAEVLAGAPARIEKYRKADAVVRVRDARGRPVPSARVRVEQVRHAFLFGANAFPLLTHADPVKEAAYQRRFTDLLNYATLGFYWGAYEPAPGQTQRDERMRQARWLKARGIAVKGHPLLWHQVYPSWAATEPEAARAQSRRRITEVVKSFAGVIDRWDVVNEATVFIYQENGVGQWAKRDGAAAVVRDALTWARAAHPKATLLYNDFNIGPDFEAMSADIVKAPAPPDALGIQSHMHRGEWTMARTWQVCETYARFGRPLHFTEATVLSGEHGWERPLPWPTTPEREAQQADYVEKFYTVLFSHPAVEAITWWDLMDGSWMGAPAGLLRADLSPKPAYDRLLRLVRHDWWTSTAGTTGRDGSLRFRGFLGRYRVTVETASGGVTREMDVRRGAPNALTVALP